MVEREIQNVLARLQQVVVGLSSIDRAHYRPQTDRHENVAEHSLSIATLAWFLHQWVSSETDLEAVLKFAIIHDFVEVYAGDVNTFASPAARMQKEVKEYESLQRIASEFEAFPDMIISMRSYQEMECSEARFVWTADKMQQLILGRMDNWRPYRERSISRQAFDDKMTEHLAQAHPELIDIHAALIQTSQETY